MITLRELHVKLQTPICGIWDMNTINYMMLLNNMSALGNNKTGV
jgi:hypothetical protein